MSARIIKLPDIKINHAPFVLILDLSIHQRVELLPTRLLHDLSDIGRAFETVYLPSTFITERAVK